MSKQAADKAVQSMPIKRASLHAAKATDKPSLHGMQLTMQTTPLAVLQLQRAIGNRATCQVLAHPGQHQRAAAKPATAPVNILLQRKIEFSGMALPEVENMIRSTPFTRRDQVDGEKSPWNLSIVFGNFGAEVHGTTKVIKNTNIIEMKLNIESLKDESPTIHLGRILETFLHEWELHGVNYTIAGAYKGVHSELLEHFNLVHNRNNIETVLKKISSGNITNVEVLEAAGKELEKDKNVHAEDLELIGLVPIAMSESTYNKAFDLFWDVKQTVEDELDDIKDLSEKWDVVVKQNMLNTFNEYFNLLFKTIVEGNGGNWKNLRKPLREKMQKIVESYTNFLEQLQKHPGAVEKQNLSNEKVEPKILSKEDTVEDEEERKPIPQRLKIATDKIQVLLKAFNTWGDRCESREKELIKVAGLFVLKK